MQKSPIDRLFKELNKNFLDVNTIKDLINQVDDINHVKTVFIKDFDANALGWKLSPLALLFVHHKSRDKDNYKQSVFEIFDALIAKGADVNRMPDDKFHTPFVSPLAALLIWYFDGTKSQKTKYTPDVDLVEKIIKKLVKERADLNVIFKHVGEYTPLEYVMKFGDPKSAQLLIDLGVDVNLPFKESGNTALHVLLKSYDVKSEDDRLAICEMLLRAGADPNKENKHKKTPCSKLMWYASDDVKLELFDVLIDRGANFLHPSVAKPGVINHHRKELDIKHSQYVYYKLLKSKVISMLEYEAGGTTANLAQELHDIINEKNMNNYGDNFVAQTVKDFQATHDEIVQKLKDKLNDKDIKTSDFRSVVFKALAIIACIFIIPAFFFINRGYRNAVFRPLSRSVVKKKAELLEDSSQLVAVYGG